MQCLHEVAHRHLGTLFQIEISWRIMEMKTCEQNTWHTNCLSTTSIETSIRPINLQWTRVLPIVYINNARNPTNKPNCACPPLWLPQMTITMLESHGTWCWLCRYYWHPYSICTITYVDFATKLECIYEWFCLDLQTSGKGKFVHNLWEEPSPIYLFENNPISWCIVNHESFEVHFWYTFVQHNNIDIRPKHSLIMGISRNCENLTTFGVLDMTHHVRLIPKALHMI